ncbi:unnamed protein product [Parascedosporium putredinis]|uniref:Uncharacterized protein n=1 Tax=Parascedosporium putredinis TaxID=1442378 RepID=A0A9P1HBX4_9PEZI|nr:unnamed protein product [Parascedosporium putredinis]CAI8002469.1 unnamed protein product [Parascedosporium putredinis]
MTKASAVMAYLAWFSISFGAFIFQIFCQDYYQDPVRQSQLTAAFLDWHFMVLNPCATAAIALSFFAQSHTTLWLRSRGALSIESLATQAIVCAALAASWSKRLAPTEDASEDPHCRFIAWYNTGGWAVFNCLLWSAVQAYLLVLSVFAMCMGPRRRTAEEKKRKKRNKLQKKQQQKAKSRKDKKPDETTPLLPLFHSSGESRLRKKKKKTDGGGERRRFRSFLAKFKWRKKQKKRKAASRWRRVLGRESSV